MLKESSNEEIMTNLKALNKPYKTINSFKASIRRGTCTTRDFIKFMLAANVSEYTIKITDEERKKIDFFLKEESN